MKMVLYTILFLFTFFVFPLKILSKMRFEFSYDIYKPSQICQEVGH